MRAWTVLPVIAAAAFAGYALGRLSVSPDAASAPPTELERVARERDEAVARAGRLDSQLVSERRRWAAERAALQEAPRTGDPAQAVPAATPDGTAAPEPAAPAAEPTAEERTAAVAALVAEIGPAFERGDGEEALRLLRRLAELAPEGRAAAMDLAVRINDDVNGDGTLRLDQYTFYTSLGDTGLRDLMRWSLENESPAQFRILSAYSLPWILPGEQKITVLADALGREKDVWVQQALVANLAQMNDSRSAQLLASILADPDRDGGIRAQIATALATSSDADVARTLERVAEADPDERVRAAARAALVARNPPVAGVLVTIVFPDGAAAAAGLRPGDILVSYDGRPTRDDRDVRAAIEAAASDTSAVVLLRDGSETTLEVRSGRLGIQGRPVRPR